jgi:hypothetical protein
MQSKQCTPQEKKTADMRAKAIKDAHATAIQQGCARVGEMEATMEVQAMQEAAKAKPVRPRRVGQ